MAVHTTPLSDHLKQKHLWFDFTLLIILWLLLFFVPANSWLQGNISILFFVKILTLVATLEFISFLSFHLSSNKNNLLVQGLLGGFISSTTIFIQLSYDKKFQNIEESTVAQAMLLAVCSMLIECLLIIGSISSNLTIYSFLPFIFMLIFIFLAIIIIKYKHKINLDEKNGQAVTSEAELNFNIEFDHPIIWKKVVKFSLYIILLKYTLLLIQKNTSIPDLIGVFLASLFEAHAILAVKITELSSLNSLQEMYLLMSVIILGSSLSKTLIVMKGKVLKKKHLVVIPIMLASVLTFIMLYLILKN